MCGATECKSTPVSDGESTYSFTAVLIVKELSFAAIEFHSTRGRDEVDLRVSVGHSKPSKIDLSVDSKELRYIRGLWYQFLMSVRASRINVA